MADPLRTPAPLWKHDGGKALPADIDAGQRIEAAVAELGFDVQHEPDEQLLILFRLDEETHSFYGKDRAAGALRFLRSELASLPQCTPIRWMTGTKLV